MVLGRLGKHPEPALLWNFGLKNLEVHMGSIIPKPLGFRV